MKPPRRRCPACEKYFEPRSNTHWICSIECARVKGNEKVEKKKTKLLKAEWTKEKSKIKEHLMTHSDWIQKLQDVFNPYIRERDKDLPCISCGTLTCDQWAAGHFIPTTYQIHRFNELNVNKQCNQYCNMHLRGNLHRYRDGLIKKIGLENVVSLEETKHQRLDLSIPQIKDLITYYRIKTKELKNGKKIGSANR